MATPPLTLCICTMNRPDDVRACRTAIRAGREPSHEIIVSEDSSDQAPTRAAAEEFPEVRYPSGSRRGPGSSRRSALIKAPLFPAELFRQVCFDENRRFRSEEIDRVRHTVSPGYKTQYRDALSVCHDPSPSHRGACSKLLEGPRMYATAKAYSRCERAPIKTRACIARDPLQLAGSAVNWKGLRGLGDAFVSTSQALRFARQAARGGAARRPQ